MTGLGSAALVGSLSALAAGLSHLGIPKEGAIKYKNAITSDKFLSHCAWPTRRGRAGAPDRR
jgi:hypothetical protein